MRPLLEGTTNVKLMSFCSGVATGRKGRTCPKSSPIADLRSRFAAGGKKRRERKGKKRARKRKKGVGRDSMLLPLISCVPSL